jgi:hypothetical protein
MTMAEKAEKDPRTVKLKGVRLSFTDALVEKKATSPENPDRKTHHLNIIIETTGPMAKHAEANKAAMTSAMKAAGEKQWKNPMAYKAIQEDSPKRVCFRKGDRFKNKEGQIYAGYEGNYAFSCTGPGGGQRRPRLIDRYKRLVLPKGDAAPTGTKLEIRNIEVSEIDSLFYSGCYADVTVSVYGTDKGSRGIFSTIEMIRSHQQGERMAGGYMFDDADLDDLDDFGDPDDMDDDFDAPASKPASKKASSIDDDDDI